MTRIPQVLGLITCRALQFDPGANAASLVGLFQSRQFGSFPSPPQEFTVYAALYDGVGEGKMTLELFRLETEEIIYSREWWGTLPGRQRLAHVEVRVKSCVFPAAGRYALRLTLDGMDLSERMIDVYSP